MARSAKAIALIACLGCQQILGIEEGAQRTTGAGGGGPNTGGTGGASGEGGVGGTGGEGGAAGAGGTVEPWMGCNDPTGSVAFITPLAVVVSGGRLALDARCNEQKGPECSTKDFVAYVSLGNAAASARLDDVQWFRPDGELIASSTYALVAGPLEHPINVAPDESVVDRFVWTGTVSTGQPSTNHCNEWTDTVGTYDAVVGDSTASDVGWTAADTVTCLEANVHLYCFQD